MNYALAIHGGAGTINKAQLTDELEKQYCAALRDALEIGEYYLKNEGSALDAVEYAVRVLEDNPLFNAGRGSVFSNTGKNEMDASIMCGKSLKAGAVSSVRHVKNPIQLARTIMDKSEYVYLSNTGAEEFAKMHDLPTEKDDYFYTEHRWDQLATAKQADVMVIDHTKDYKFGTVGAVALDVYGNIAAATSTGGLTNKKYGRIGDSSIIGAGTYANNASCAISCTGYGEYFIRSVVGHDVACLMEYRGLSLQEACDMVVMDKLIKMGGEGGLIAVDHQGNIVFSFNSEGMYRGMVSSENAQQGVWIYRN